MWEEEFNFNPDWQRRNELLRLFVSAGQGTEGDLFHFDNLPFEVLALLFDERHLDPDDYQNSSPTIAQFLEFMDRYRGVLAHGYAVNIHRDDYRVSIEGVRFRGQMSREMHNDAEMLFRNADVLELEFGHLYVWYD